MWYVIQITTGRENSVLRLIDRAVAEYAREHSVEPTDVLQECFSPRYRTARRVPAAHTSTQPAAPASASRAGVTSGPHASGTHAASTPARYLPTTELLLPGYLIAVTKNPAQLQMVLKRVPALSKLLKSENAFTPLTRQEVSWLCAFTQKGNRVVDMSEGFTQGGRVVVTSGPLMGYEGQIAHINRRKRTASVKMSMCGRTVEVKLGFHLVKKQD